MKDFAKGIGGALILLVFGHWILRACMVGWSLNAIVFAITGEPFMEHKDYGPYGALVMCTGLWLLMEVVCGWFRAAIGIDD